MKTYEAWRKRLDEKRPLSPEMAAMSATFYRHLSRPARTLAESEEELRSLARYQTGERAFSCRCNQGHSPDPMPKPATLIARCTHWLRRIASVATQNRRP